jgi:hypothetical protein
MVVFGVSSAGYATRDTRTSGPNLKPLNTLIRPGWFSG